VCVCVCVCKQEEGPCSHSAAPGPLKGKKIPGRVKKKDLALALSLQPQALYPEDWYLF
jgi:hypothetical protein